MSLARLLFAAAMLAVGVASAEVRIIPQDSGVKVRLRGISAVSEDVAWASGREGTVLRTIDGGQHWQIIKVPDAEALDFRDVEGFDANTAVVLSIGAGEASRVYRTEDGGKSWKLTLQNNDPRAFLDCMAFEGKRGWILGDPVAGRFQVLTTRDGGRRWKPLKTDLPQAKTDEAAYAASGTCIARTPWGELLAVSGGSAARAFLGDSGERLWWAYETQMPHRVPTAGIFSAAPMGEQALLLVGGDFEREAETGSAALVHFVDEHGLTVEPLPSPRGFRSGAACLLARDPLCVAVGPKGVDQWDGTSWLSLSDTGYDAIDLAGNIGWATGYAGRIARIEIGR